MYWNVDDCVEGKFWVVWDFGFCFLIDVRLLRWMVVKFMKWMDLILILVLEL